MQYKLLSLAALAASVSAQQLTSLLGNNSDLSSLSSYVTLFPQLVTTLSSATNITILAPSNAAFAKYMNSSAGAAIAANDTAAIQALLTYHVLNGTHYASTINGTAAFVPTMLSNAAYTNVTGGQRVEAIAKGENVTFYSGLLQNSTVTQAVSHLILPWCPLTNRAEHQLHRWCYPRHRHCPHGTTEHLLYCCCSRPERRCWCSYKCQPCRCCG